MSTCLSEERERGVGGAAAGAAGIARPQFTRAEPSAETTQFITPQGFTCSCAH